MTVSAYATAGGYQTIPSPETQWRISFRDVCHDVKVEPQLQKVNEGDCLNPKTITDDQARLDVFARGGLDI